MPSLAYLHDDRTAAQAATSKISKYKAMPQTNRSAKHCTPNVLEIQMAIAGDNCASIQIVMQPELDDPVYEQQPKVLP